MSESINLSKKPSKNVCIQYKKINMQVKPYTNLIQLDQKPLDIVNINVTGFYKTLHLGSKYYVIFLYSSNKWSKAIFFKKKSRILLFLKRYCLKNEKVTKEFDNSRQIMIENMTLKILLGLKTKKYYMEVYYFW